MSARIEGFDEQDYDIDDNDVRKDDDITSHNRDVTKWIDRLERGKLFVDSADKAIEIIGNVLTRESANYFKEEYKAHSEGNVEAQGVIADAFIKPPNIKKIHQKGDNSSHFSQFKEYPHYFIMSVNNTFNIDATNDEMRKPENSKYFVEKYKATIESSVNNRIGESIQKKLNEKFTDVFYFPNGSVDFKEGQINILVTSAITINTKGGMMKRSPIVPHKNSEDYREMLVRELSVTLGRIIVPPAKSEENK